MNKMVHLCRSIATPLVWILGLLLLGLVLAKFRRRKALSKLGLYFVLCATIVLYLFSIPPISRLLAGPLEFRYERPSCEVLAELDLVVVLGAGYYRSGGFRDCPELTEVTYARLVNGVTVFRQSRAGTLAVCGGGSGGEAAATIMKDLALRLGVPETKIIAQARSYNTWQDATELKRLLPEQQGKRIGLVTSALHIPRAVSVFEEVFSDNAIVPIPVNYMYVRPATYVPNFVPSAKTLLVSTYAVHEWIGMLWYKLRY
jgi:uncharacterized SAM-binding protein YcdF (DUF218 family)